MKTGKQLMKDWFEQVWNQGREELISEMMCETCEVQGLGLEEKGPNAFLGFYRTFQNAFESIHIELLEQVEEKDVVFATCQFTAIHRERKKEVSMVFTASGRWYDEKLVEARNVVDFLALLTQLGEVDDRALEKVLV